MAEVKDSVTTVPPHLHATEGGGQGDLRLSLGRKDRGRSFVFEVSVPSHHLMLSESHLDPD